MTESTIRVTAPGLLTTVQDLGRRGFQKYGVPVCGALDAVSMRIANILVGNPETLAGLEITFAAPELVFSRDAAIALVGADFAPVVDGVEARAWESVRVPAGAAVSFRAPADGLRAWLAVDGGIDVPTVMGSRSTDLKGGFGGHEGRALMDGDILPLGHPPHPRPTAPARLPSEISRQPTYGQSFEIRVVLGPQNDRFTDAGVSAFLQSEYAVSPDADRTGYRLDGPAIEHAGGAGIISDGTTLGSVQVPGAGTPIILLADRGTTGGYAKIATVISPDIGLLAQAMPGAKIRFRAVSESEAREALLEQEAMMREIKSRVGLDLSGAISVSADGVRATVTDAGGRPIALPDIGAPSKRSVRTVSVIVDGEKFDVQVETGVA